MALYLLFKNYKMSKHFSLYLFLKANFSLCCRQNCIFCDNSSFWSRWLDILPAAYKLNLGPNIIAFTLRQFWFEPKASSGYNFDRGRGELNHNNSRRRQWQRMCGIMFLDEVLSDTHTCTHPYEQEKAQNRLNNRDIR